MWFKGPTVCPVITTNGKEISLAGREKYQIFKLIVSLPVMNDGPVCGIDKRQLSGTDKIEFRILPKASNGTEKQTSRTATQAEGQDVISFEADGHPIKQSKQNNRLTLLSRNVSLTLNFDTRSKWTR